MGAWRSIFPTYKSINLFRIVLSLLLVGFLAFTGFLFRDYRSMEFTGCEFEEESDEQLKFERVPIYDGRAPPGKYRLVEYLTNGKARKEIPLADRDDYDWEHKDIPVVFIPGSGDHVLDQRFLAKVLQKRANEEGFQFRFYSLDFNEEQTYVNGWHLERQTEFTSRALLTVLSMHKAHTPILIGREFGGTVAQAVTTMYSYVTEHMKDGNMTELVIMEGSSLKQPMVMVDGNMRHFYGRKMKSWHRKREWVKTALVSIDPGYNDGTTHPSLMVSQDVTKIFSWIIDGTPSKGLDRDHMLRCKCFLNHIADLCMTYVYEHSETRYGKHIVEDFYKHLEEEKQATLPEGWKKDVMPEGTLTVGSNFYFEFMMENVKWLDVKVERSEFLSVYVHSKCLKSATVIRERRHIRRITEKNVTAEGGTWFCFTVTYPKPFEDIRVVLESDGPCSVYIYTTKPWAKYFYRFRDASIADYQALYVASIISATFLLIIQDEAPYTRAEFQVEFLIVNILIIWHQMFSFMGNSMGFFAVGACWAIGWNLAADAFYYLVSHKIAGVDIVTRVSFHPILDKAYIVAFVISFISVHWGFVALLIIVSAYGRYSDIFFVVLINGILNEKAARTSWILSCVHEGLNEIHGMLVATTGIYWYFRKETLPRIWMYLIMTIVFILQLFHREKPLEYHFSCMFGLFLLNRLVKKRIPKELRDKPEPDWDIVEMQNDNMDKFVGGIPH